MEELKKRWGDQERKKMAIKMGGSGAGIGAVVLLGGALATAALASVFIVRKKGRSPGKDSSRRLQSQDSPPEINKQNKEDEGNIREKFTFLDQPSYAYKHPSGGETKEVEQDNHTGSLVSTESLKLDEKARDEINGGTQSDVYEDDFVIIEDKKLSLVPQIMTQEDEVKTELNKEDGCNKISQESKEIAQDDTEGERAEREPSGDGKIHGINLSPKEATEITEMQPGQEENAEMCYDQEEIKVTVDDSVFEGVDNDEKEVLKNVIMEVKMEEKEMEGFCSDNGEINEKKCEEAFGNSETIVSESHGDDGKEVLLPIFESQVIKEKNVNGDEKEGNSVTGIVDIIQIDEVKCIEKLVKEEDKCDQIDGIVLEKGEEEQWTGESNESNAQSSVGIQKGEEKIDSESKEDDATIGNPALENGQFGVPVLEEEVISHEVTKENGADVEEIAESLEVNKDETSMIGENLEEDEEKTAIVAENQEEDGEKIALVAESLGVNEDETSIVAQNLEVDEEKIALVAESLEVNEDETSMVAQNLEVDEEKIALVAESLEVSEDETSQNMEVDKEKIAIVAESLEENEDETSMVAQNLEVDEEKIALAAESLEVSEDETSQNVEVDKEKIAIVAESLEVNEDETSMAAQNLEVDEEKIAIVAESLEVNEDEASMAAQNLEVNEEKIAIVAESLEVKEDDCQSKGEEDDCQSKGEEDDSKENIAKKVEEELISPEDTPVMNELNDNKISTELADNYQPKDHEHDTERTIATEVDEDVITPENIEVTKEDSENEEVEVGIAKAEDDMIMEMSEDEEKDTSEDEEKGESNLSDEVEEGTVGTGDSSTESNSEVIWPAESLQETSVEPQKKLIDQEVEGKIQEDKPVEESEYNSQDSSFDPYQVKAEESDSWKISANQPTQVVSSQFSYENGDSNKTFVKRYTVNSTRWKMLIGALSVVSSLSCSWFFGLSFIKLGLIVFLAMVLSKIHGY